jgi:NAD+ synthase (glutamine-hydrolysing)
MKLARFGFGSPDPTVGAFVSNTGELIEQAKKMAASNCSIGVFPEQSIPGYPVEDLVLWEQFIDGQWVQLERFAKATAEYKTVFVLGLAVQHGASAYNVAAVVHMGEILGLVPKEKLPTYGVFYEKRTYAAGIPGFVDAVNGIPFGDVIFQFSFGKMAVEVCEDIWSPDGPMRRRSYSGAEIIVNISASPFRAGVVDTRKELISTRASDNIALVAYCNQRGGNDGLAFDGGSFLNVGGTMEFVGSRWTEGVCTTDVDLDRISRKRRENSTWRSDCETFLRTQKPCQVIVSNAATTCRHHDFRYPFPGSRNFFIPSDSPSVNPRDQYFEDILQAELTGLDGYFRKSRAFKCIGASNSGGKDSGLSILFAYLYAKKRGVSAAEMPTFIQCFSFPTDYNSDLTKTIARDMCAALGVGFKEIPIGVEVEQAMRDVRLMFPEGVDFNDVGLQNVQARIRAKRMRDWANATGGMMLQMSNMSEKAVGYGTIGGDLEGDYSLLSDLPKSVSIELLKYMNRKYFELEVIDRLIASEASAELKKGQADERDLMPFVVLDACINLFVGERMGPHEVLEVLIQMFESMYGCEQLKKWVARFINLFFNSLYKWVQSCESVHLGGIDLDRERALQLLAVMSNEWLELDKL